MSIEILLYIVITYSVILSALSLRLVIVYHNHAAENHAERVKYNVRIARMKSENLSLQHKLIRANSRFNQ